MNCGMLEAGWRPGRAGDADRKRRGRAVQHVAHELGISYPPETRLRQIVLVYWHSGPERVRTVFSSRQVLLFYLIQTDP